MTQEATTQTTAPVAAPAPAVPAPVTPPTPAPVPVASPAPQVTTAASPFEPTGDAGLDYALSRAATAGLQPDSVALAAAAKGDWSLVEAHLRAAGLPDADHLLRLAKEGLGRVQGAAQTQAQAAAQEAEKGVQAALGEAAKWADVQAWALELADAPEKAQINSALKAGGIVAFAVARELAERYAGAKGTQAAPRQAPTKTASPLLPGAAVAPAEAGLSAVEYQIKVAAAVKDGSWRNPATRAALDSARQLGLKQGR